MPYIYIYIHCSRTRRPLLRNVEMAAQRCSERWDFYCLKSYPGKRTHPSAMEMHYLISRRHVSAPRLRERSIGLSRPNMTGFVSGPGIPCTAQGKNNQIYRATILLHLIKMALFALCHSPGVCYKCIKWCYGHDGAGGTSETDFQIRAERNRLEL